MKRYESILSKPCPTPPGWCPIFIVARCDWQCCPHIRYLHVPALYLAIVHPTPRPSSIADEFAKSPSFLVCIDDQCNSKPFVPDTAAFARRHYFIIISKSTCQSHSKWPAGKNQKSYHTVDWRMCCDWDNPPTSIHTYIMQFSTFYCGLWL